ncbi:alpha-1,6-mannosyltransferase subunit [Phlegmacium glaucopus]|nr:alpha-1,6-mannosyltransferase subunit [Phlegmacium glaucopus]
MSLSDALIFATAWTHVLLAPYTKVEESFNLHATHDVLMYGVGIDNLYNYDQFTFPGAVPRTFIGSVLLAWIAVPVIQLATWLGLATTKFDLQIIVRLVLASLNAWTLCLLKRGTARRFGRTTGLLFAISTCSQFHLPFWMGRTIPNMFALIPVNLATSFLIDGAPKSTSLSSRSINFAIALLTFTAVVFRAEVVLFLGPLVLQLLFTHQISFVNLIKVGLLSGLCSLALTITVDSYFWNNYPIWPEFSGIYFNVVEGKSSEWGTSPPFTYVTSYLPKLLLGSLPLLFIGLITNSGIRSLLFAPLIFIGLISCLGHKEWRFIVYVVPIFNVAAARGAQWMVSKRKNNIFSRIFSLAPLALIVGNLFATILLTQASMANYPGGQALAIFHQSFQHNTHPQPHVHISNLAAQSGASLFLQLHSSPHYLHQPLSNTNNEWIYNKTENLTIPSLCSSSITHLISEIPPSKDPLLDKHWYTVEVIKGFDHWTIDWDVLTGRGDAVADDDLLGKFRAVLRLIKSDKLWILARKK